MSLKPVVKKLNIFLHVRFQLLGLSPDPTGTLP